jgi:hypothetical protein
VDIVVNITINCTEWSVTVQDGYQTGLYWAKVVEGRTGDVAARGGLGHQQHLIRIYADLMATTRTADDAS